MMRRCLTTSDPGPWKAGVDDTADPEMIGRMHSLRDGMNRNTPTSTLINQLQAAMQIDSRTTLGGDIQRCLLSNAADRLMLLIEHTDPAPWRTWRQNLRDALAVYQRKAVAIYVEGNAYDRRRR